NTARARIASFEAQIKASEIALEGVQQEAKVGSRTVLDVLNAEQDLLNAKTNLVQSTRDRIVAGYQLASAIGTLTAVDMGLSVEVYTPTANYSRVRTKWWGNKVDEYETRPR